jgi:hypothetical protein
MMSVVKYFTSQVHACESFASDCCLSQPQGIRNRRVTGAAYNKITVPHAKRCSYAAPCPTSHVSSTPLTTCLVTLSGYALAIARSAPSMCFLRRFRLVCALLGLTRQRGKAVQDHMGPMRSLPNPRNTRKRVKLRSNQHRSLGLTLLLPNFLLSRPKKVDSS